MMCFGYNLSSLPGPDFSRESYDENLKLAKLWDAKGLLALFQRQAPMWFVMQSFERGQECQHRKADW